MVIRVGQLVEVADHDIERNQRTDSANQSTKDLPKQNVRTVLGEGAMESATVSLQTISHFVPPNVRVNSKGQKVEQNISKKARGMIVVALADLVHIPCNCMKEEAIVKSAGDDGEKDHFE